MQWDLLKLGTLNLNQNYGLTRIVGKVDCTQERHLFISKKCRVVS